MKFEDREKNAKPKVGKNTNLPTVVLFVLVGIICLLLYVGWQYLGDTPSNAEEMTPTQPDAVSEQIDSEKDNIATSTESTPAETTVPDVDVAQTPVEPEKPKTENTETVKTTTPAVAAEKPKEEVKKATVTPNLGGTTYQHTVASGETFFSIATRYNVSQETLKSYNPTVSPESIKVGVTTLKIPINTIHTVGPGDILRVVASKYGISVETLMKANGKTKNFAQRGEKLVIPFATKK